MKQYLKLWATHIESVYWKNMSLGYTILVITEELQVKHQYLKL